MGTSKGYIAPTRLEWSNAKRSVTTYLRNMNFETKAKTVAKYAKAMYTNKVNNSKKSVAFSSSFSSAAGNVIIFAKEVADNGLDGALNQFGRNDLIGKPPGIIINELLNQFTNHASTIDDSLSLNALSSTFNKLEIESPDDLANIDLDVFLFELIIAFVNINFDFRFYEKISCGRTPEETIYILNYVHDYIDGTLRNNLTIVDISKINLSKMDTNKIITDMLNDAFYTCMDFYGVEAQ